MSSKKKKNIQRVRSNPAPLSFQLHTVTKERERQCVRRPGPPISESKLGCDEEIAVSGIVALVLTEDCMWVLRWYLGYLTKRLTIYRMAMCAIVRTDRTRGSGMRRVWAHCVTDRTR